jgi:hypothetical protein
MATVEEQQPTAVPETENEPKNGKNELQDSDAWDVLGYSFPTWRKW